MSGGSFLAAKFRIGRIVATPNALASVSHPDILNAIARHQAGDWGEVPAEDRLANDSALKTGSRLLSAYLSSTGERFWLITEADRSLTTVLLPEDY